MGPYTLRSHLVIHNHCGFDLKSKLMSCSSNFDPSPKDAIDGVKLDNQVIKAHAKVTVPLEPARYHHPNKIDVGFFKGEEKEFQVMVDMNPTNDGWGRRLEELTNERVGGKDSFFSVLSAYDQDSHTFTMDIFLGLPPANWTVPGPRPSNDINWNKYAKDGVVELLGMLPDEGFTAKLVSLFWPDNEPSIWDQVKEQVEHMVDSKILQKELQDHKSTIGGIKRTLQEYTNDDGPDKGGLLTAAIGDVNILFQSITNPENENIIHFLPLAVNTAILHMSMLREMYKRQTIVKPDNAKTWAHELELQYSEYMTFFNNTYPKWEGWRFGHIHMNVWSRYAVFFFINGKVNDAVTGHTREIEMQYDGTSGTDHNRTMSFMKKSTGMIHESIKNEARARMAATLAPVFVLNRFLVGHELDKPAPVKGLDTITLGPYNAAVLRGSKAPDPSLSHYGMFSGHVNLHVGQHVVNGIEHNNEWVGTKEGDLVTIAPFSSGAYLTGARIKFSRGWIPQVGGIEFFDSENGTSGNLPAKDGWGGDTVVMNPGTPYELVGGRFQAWDLENWNGQPPAHNLKTVEFQFKVHGV